MKQELNCDNRCCMFPKEAAQTKKVLFYLYLYQVCEGPFGENGKM